MKKKIRFQENVTGYKLENVTDEFQLRNKHE